MLTAALHWVRFRMEPQQFWSTMCDLSCSMLHKHSSVWQDAAGRYVRCLDCGRRVPSN
jgi:hypothetical protein